MTKIYTKRGDTGDSDLFGGGQRVKKDSTRVMAIGEVDELNAQLGVVRSLTPDQTIDVVLETLQHQLFTLGADLATPLAAPVKIERIQAVQIERLELVIDELETTLSSLTAFILPGGIPVAAHLHLARTICRRAERSVVTLDKGEELNPEIIKYLNRLSDLLFVLARFANHHAGKKDVLWKK